MVTTRRSVLLASVALWMAACAISFEDFPLATGSGGGSSTTSAGSTATATTSSGAGGTGGPAAWQRREDRS